MNGSCVSRLWFQELPSRSVSGILQWYKAAVRELTQIRRLLANNQAASSRMQYYFQGFPDELPSLPTEEDLISWQRQLLVELASSSAAEPTSQVTEDGNEL